MKFQVMTRIEEEVWDGTDKGYSREKSLGVDEVSFIAKAAFLLEHFIGKNSQIEVFKAETALIKSEIHFSFFVVIIWQKEEIRINYKTNFESPKEIAISILLILESILRKKKEEAKKKTEKIEETLTSFQSKN